MSKDQRRAQTKKALLDALVICLEDQDFNDITHHSTGSNSRD